MSTPPPGQPSQPRFPSSVPWHNRPSSAQVRFFVACGLLLALITTTAVASAASGRARPTGRATPRPARTHTPAPAPTATLPVEPPTSVYFIASSAGTGATLNALDGASGASRWSKPIPGVTSAQIAVGENIVFVLASSGKLRAFQAANGEQIALHQPSLSGKFIAPPVVDASADLLYASSQGDATTHGMVYALRAGDGFVRWTYDAGANVSPMLAAAGGTLYVHAGNTLLAFNGLDGTQVWHTTLEAVAPTAPPVLADDGGVYLTSAGVVYRYVAADSKLAWQYPSQGLGSPSDGVPISAGDGLAIFSSGDTLTGLNSETGQRAWTQPEPSPIVGTAYHGHALYVALQNGALLDLEVSASAANKSWNKSLGSSVLAPQIVADRTVYTVAVSGAAPQATTTIYALDPQNGTPRWPPAATGGSVVQFVVA